MIDRRFALPTLLATLFGLGVMAMQLDVGTVDVDSPLAVKLAAAERSTVYAVTPTTGPSFRLIESAETILLSAHLLLPLDKAYDPDANYRFDIIVTLRAPDGTVLHTWTVSKRTRQTKADALDDTSWGHETAFVLDGSMQLSDGGGIELELPPCPLDSRLEIRLGEEAGVLGPQGPDIVTPFPSPTALVRIYRKITVDPREREVLALQLADDDNGHRLGSSTYLPWYSLRLDQQLRHLGHAWVRLAPEGTSGIDYIIHNIYVTAARPPETPEFIDPPIEVGTDQPALVHLSGPGIVIVRARLAPSENSPPSAPASLELRTRWLGLMAEPLHEDAASSQPLPSTVGDTVRALPLPASNEWQELAIPVPVGWTTLTLHSDAPRIQAHVLADDITRHIGADPHEQHRDSHLRPFVPVDSQAHPLYVTGPTMSPLVATLAYPLDIYSRIVKVDLRTTGNTPTPVPVQIEFLDTEGSTMASVQQIMLPPGPAPFDRISRAFPVPSDTIDTPSHRPNVIRLDSGFPLGDTLVSEVTTVRVIAPIGADKVRVSSQVPALIRLRSELPPPARNDDESPWISPYDQISTEGERWHYVPLRQPRWFTLKVEDHAERLSAGEVMLLRGQSRLVPFGNGTDTTAGMTARSPATASGSSSSAGPWRAIHPHGLHPRTHLLERVRSEHRSGTLAHWNSGNYAGLRRGASVGFNLAQGGPAPPQLLYQVTSESTAAIGQILTFQSNDTSMEWQIAGRSDHLTLPRLEGRSTLTWTSGPKDLILLVDRKPLSHTPIYEHRLLHQLGRGGLAVQVDKPATGPVVVNAVIYWLGGAPSSASEIQLRIDGGDPERQVETPFRRLTNASRRIAAVPNDTADVLFADRRGEAHVHTQRITITLGSDIAPGRHALHLSLINGSPVWMRFFRHGVSRPSAGAWQWNERRTSAIMDDSDEQAE